MKLTGKTLTDFWLWYLLPEQRKAYKTTAIQGSDDVIKIRFISMSFTERYGVYVDFFDSVGMKLSVCWIEPTNNDKSNWWGEILTKGKPNEFGFEWLIEYENTFESRPEARSATIEKAKEIYNKKS